MLKEFPFRDGVDIELLVDGSAFYNRLLHRIQRASRSILIELYLVESGTITRQVFEALTAAAERGVIINMLLDSIGSRGLSQADKDWLHSVPNITLRHYNPVRFSRGWQNVFRDHRKLIIIDDEYGFIGGAGIADCFLSDDDHGWHELMVELKGPIVNDLTQLFYSTWLQKLIPSPCLDFPATVGPRSARVRLLASQGLRRRIKHTILHQIQCAQRRVWILTPYFFPSYSIRSALRKAAQKGVDVCLVLPSEKTDHPLLRYASHKFYRKQLHQGVKIYEYQPRFSHAKAVLCDQWATVGSFNLDLWSIRWNLEANIETASTDFVQQLAAQFERDKADSVRIDKETWHQRSLKRKLMENFAFMLARLFLLFDRPADSD